MPLFHSRCEHTLPIRKRCFLVCKPLKTLQVQFYQFAPANIWETQHTLSKPKENTYPNTAATLTFITQKSTNILHCFKSQNLARIFSFPNESFTQLQAQAVILANKAKKTTQETDQFHRKKCLCFHSSFFSFNARVQMLPRFSFFTKFLNSEAQVSEMTWPYNSVKSTINQLYMISPKAWNTQRALRPTQPRVKLILKSKTKFLSQGDP